MTFLAGAFLAGAFLAAALAGAFLAGAFLAGAFLAGSLGGGQLDADQLGGALADRAGLRGHVAQRFLGQLDGLVDVTLDLRGGILEVRLVAQPLEGGLAALDEAVVGRGGVLDEAVGSLAQLLGAQLATQFLGALRQIFLQLGQRGTTLLDTLGGLGAGVAGALAQVGQDLVDGGQGQVGGADCSEQRGLQVFDGGVLGHVEWLLSCCPNMLWLMGFQWRAECG